jgi:nicotinate-nucleotide adenylyltransferase
MTEDFAPCRLGIYGGTFSPPHAAHVRAALEFLRQASLERLLVMPAYLPPHKRVAADDDPDVRLEMARAAFEGTDPRISVSDYEIRRAGVSYTSDTLTHFAPLCRGRPVFLCGTDMFLTMWSWHRPEIIFSVAEIACVMRVRDPAAFRETVRRAGLYREQFGARILLLEGEPMELSSTEIRARIRRGESVEGMVPDAVRRIIEKRGLYRREEGFQ